MYVYTYILYKKNYRIILMYIVRSLWCTAKPSLFIISKPTNKLNYFFTIGILYYLGNDSLKFIFIIFFNNQFFLIYKIWISSIRIGMLYYHSHHYKL